MKRYKFFYDQLCSEAHSCGMEENKDGVWVKYEDVIELADENEILKDEIKYLQTPKKYEEAVNFWREEGGE